MPDNWFRFLGHHVRVIYMSKLQSNPRENWSCLAAGAKNSQVSCYQGHLWQTTRWNPSIMGFEITSLWWALHALNKLNFKCPKGAHIAKNESISRASWDKEVEFYNFNFGRCDITNIGFGRKCYQTKPSFGRLCFYYGYFVLLFLVTL